MKLVITQGTTPFAQRLAKRFGGGQICFAASDPVPQVLLDTGGYKAIPAAGDATFVHELLKLALDLDAAYLLPLGREEAVTLAGSKLLFSEYGIRILVPDAESFGALQLVENPPRQLDLVVLDEGRRIDADTGMDAVWEQYPTADVPEAEIPAARALSGVFCFNDDGEPFLCLSSAAGTRMT